MNFVIDSWGAVAIFAALVLVGIALAVPGAIALYRTSRARANGGNGVAEALRQHRLENEQRMEELRKSLWSQAQAEIDDLRQELADEGTKRRQLEEIVVIWSAGINLLISQLRQLDIVPVWEPPPESIAWLQQYNQQRLARMSQARLLALIDNHFSLEELDALACDLNIDPENLPGRTKVLRGRSLVDAARRYDRLPDLYVRLKQLRPTVAWPAITE